MLLSDVSRNRGGYTLLTALSFGASGKGGERIPTVGGLGGEDIA
jgi:hypothetical protein